MLLKLSLIFLIYIQTLIIEIKSFKNSFLEMNSLNKLNTYLNKQNVINEIQQPKKFLDILTNNTNVITNDIKKTLPKNLLGYNITNIKDISNITNKFNCFHFNYEDFSVFDLSHLDKIE